MQVASLENCKKLYELSGWETTDWHMVYELGGRQTTQIVPKNALTLSGKAVDKAPAYDLGYLLRKLPSYIATHDKKADDYLLSLRPNFDGNEWTAAYWGLELALYLSMADTPEDAVALLAIKLFEEGILTAPSKAKRE